MQKREQQEQEQQEQGQQEQGQQDQEQDQQERTPPESTKLKREHVTCKQRRKPKLYCTDEKIVRYNLDCNFILNNRQ